MSNHYKTRTCLDFGFGFRHGKQLHFVRLRRGVWSTPFHSELLSDVIFVSVHLWSPVRFYVVNTNDATQDFDGVEVVNGKNRASLIFVAHKTIPFRFSRVFVTNQVDVYNFSISRQRNCSLSLPMVTKCTYQPWA